MQKYYRFLHCDDLVRKNSSSGGAFTAISDQILVKRGIVYGCIMDESMQVKHIRATDREERDRMRGSKYIQSDIKELFQQIKCDLENGKIVLVTGTPCQNFAVLKYLSLTNTCTDRLITMEVVCHGVGSKLLFDDYIHHLETRYRGNAVKANFRAKHYKGQKQDMEVIFDNEKIYNASSTKYDWFYSIYLKNLILRPSCYECPFSQRKRFSDLTIADHWGYQDEKAYSLIVSNSLAGDEILQLIKGISENDLEEITEQEVRQPHMVHPCDRPIPRDEFWNIYHKNGYLAVQKWFGNNTVSRKLMNFIALLVRKSNFASLIRILKCCYKRVNIKR